MFDIQNHKLQEWLFTVDIQNSYFVQIKQENGWKFISESNPTAQCSVPTVYDREIAIQELERLKGKYPIKIVRLSRYIANGNVVITSIFGSSVK